MKVGRFGIKQCCKAPRVWHLCLRLQHGKTFMTWSPRSKAWMPCSQGFTPCTKRGGLVWWVIMHVWRKLRFVSLYNGCTHPGALMGGYFGNEMVTCWSSYFIIDREGSGNRPFWIWDPAPGWKAKGIRWKSGSDPSTR